MGSNLATRNLEDAEYDSEEKNDFIFFSIEGEYDVNKVTAGQRLQIIALW